MFPKMGKVFPNGDSGAIRGVEYRVAIAEALKRELGGTHRAIKITMKWTGVSERTAKNWISGAHGPSGEHLIALMRNSQEVLWAVMALAGVSNSIVGIEYARARERLVEALRVIDANAEEIDCRIRS